MAKKLTQAERGARAIAALPASVRVRGFDIELGTLSRSEASAEGRVGDFDSIHERIRIIATPSSAPRAAEILLHEIAHAVWWSSNLTGPVLEEAAVAEFASGMMQVYRDNPWLLTWLGEQLR